MSTCRSLHSKSVRAAATTIAALAALCLSGCNHNQFGLAPQQQTFGQQIVYNTKVDMLFLVDNSGSMGPKEIQLSNGFQPFIQYMVNSGFDFHIAVTTLDMSGAGASGHFVGTPSVLTNATPNLLNDFISNVSQGINGSDLGRGLQAMQTSLSPALLGGANAGFLRSDALLALVFLTDTDDGSPNQPQDYVNFLNTLKPAFPSGSLAWVANSIVVPSLTDQCKTFNQFAAPGLRYIALSQASGGAVESICNTDLVSASKDIGQVIVSLLTQYKLQGAADPNSIQVTINGVSIPQDPVNGWTYDTTTNIITFHGSSVPQAFADVEVAYKPVSVNH